MPRQSMKSRIARSRIILCAFFDTAPEVVHEPNLAARVAGRVRTFITKLQQPLRVGEGSIFFSSAGGGKQEYFGSYGFRGQFSGLSLRRVVPERRCLSLHHVAHDEPFQLGQSFAFQAAVGRSHRWVLPHDEEAIHFAIRHIEPVTEMRVIASNSGQPVESPVVILGCSVAVISLQQADEVLVKVRPQSGTRLMALQVLLELVSVRFEQRHRNVAGQNVVEGWNVRGTLNGSVATQGENASSRSSNVP